MKSSLFNIAAPRDDGSVIAYNTLTRALCVLPAELAGITAGWPLAGAEDGIAFEPAGIGTQAAADAQIAPLLGELGFLVDDEADELADLRARYRTDAASTAALCLMVAPTLSCNLACPYCYEREVKHPGAMDGETMDALVAFIERQRDERGFSKLKVGWYGGEPLLGIEVIERLTERFRDLGMEYTATMTSNLALCDKAMADRIAACGIVSVLATLDGVGPEHESRRPALDGKPSYGAILEAIRLLSARGIAVQVICNLEKGNLGQPELLKQELEGLPLVTVGGTQSYDYCGLYGHVEDFAPPRYELIDDPLVMAQIELARIRGMRLRPFEYEAMLSPIRLFCGRQLEGYCVVDERGRIYECDGDIGYVDRAIGDVRGGAMPPHAPYDPTDDAYCTGCALLPLCLGNCRWTREHSPMKVCLPIRWVLGDVLADWCAAVGSPLRAVEGVEVMNEPAALSRLGAFELWGS